MKVHNLLSFLYLLGRQTKGKEPLIDYFKSHIVTFDEYIYILQKKAMDKATIKTSCKNGDWV
jgi:hypothetical protein